MMKHFCFLFLICFTFPLALFAGEPTIADIVNHVDKLYRSSTSYGEMEMQIETPDFKRTMKLKTWSEGMKKTFITILEPKKDAGTSTLRVDNEMWNFFPNINKVMKVPPSMMMGSWMGSDFTNDDLVKESTLLDDYTSKFAANPPDKEHYYIELTPKANTATVWGKIVVKVAKANLMPVTQEYFDEKGKKIRVMNFKEIKELGGKKIPTVMELVSLTKQGNRTMIIYKDAKFDIKLEDDVFSLRNLQKKR